MEMDSGAEVDLRKIPKDKLQAIKQRIDAKKLIKEFNISDSSFLDESDGRSRCITCNKSCKYFCYSCPKVLPIFKGRTPTLQLPFLIDIVKHPKEISGKSTAIHAALISPDQVTIYSYPDIPDYSSSNEQVILISPGRNSISLNSFIAQSHSSTTHSDGKPFTPFHKVVLIDSTWKQVKSMIHDKRFRGLQCIQLSEHQTMFWRYQTGKPDTYLATIEAVYYLLLCYHKIMVHDMNLMVTSKNNKEDEEMSKDKEQNEVTTSEVKPLAQNSLFIDSCCHKYDDLLFYFKFMFCKIQDLYGIDNLRAYK